MLAKLAMTFSTLSTFPLSSFVNVYLHIKMVSHPNLYTLFYRHYDLIIEIVWNTTAFTFNFL
jgi:hypothetical protein